MHVELYGRHRGQRRGHLVGFCGQHRGGGRPDHLRPRPPVPNTVNFAETNTPGSATQVAISPTPATATASNTTDMKLNLQLEDQYGNATTNTGAPLTLTLSTSSARGFFAATNGGTGTLGGNLQRTFGTGVGTGAAYYGDETAGTPTITAKNGGYLGTYADGDHQSRSAHHYDPR